MKVIFLLNLMFIISSLICCYAICDDCMVILLILLEGHHAIFKIFYIISFFAIAHLVVEDENL